MAAYVEAGCDTVVSLGGDGTNRAITRAAPDVNLVALSTGTNNVFPQLLEPTIGGMVAGLVAAGRLSRAHLARRAKVLRLRFSNGTTDVGLIDAALLRDDFVGNFLPFDANTTRAHSADARGTRFGRHVTDRRLTSIRLARRTTAACCSRWDRVARFRRRCRRACSAKYPLRVTRAFRSACR